MKIFVPGTSRMIAPAAEKPSRPAIRKSMSITSGRSVRASWTPSRPLAASPMTSSPG